MSKAPSDAKKRALIVGGFDGEQLIEERRDLRGGRSRHDRFGERLERLRLMRVEEHRRRGSRRSLLRLLDRVRIQEMPVDRMLRGGT